MTDQTPSIPAEPPLAGDEGKGVALLARTYAQALLNAAEKADAAQAVHEELDSLLGDLFARQPRLEAILTTPTIKRAAKGPLIRKALGQQASPMVMDFLLVLNKHDRLALIRPVVQAYRDLSDSRAKRVRVLVRSAVALSGEQQETLKATLRASTQREPVLDLRVDPELLGGMVVQIGDSVYDGTVRTRIETLRNQLLARSSYEIQTGRDRFSSAT